MTGLKGPLSCLSEARFGIVWGVTGAARACLEAAIDYATTREQFGKKIGGFQLTQGKLAWMLADLQRAQLLALHLGRLKEAGKITPEQVSLGKMSNVRTAIDIARQAQDHPRRQRGHAGVPGDQARQQPGVRAHLRGHRGDPHAGDRPGPHRHLRLPLSPPERGRRPVRSRRQRRLDKKAKESLEQLCDRTACRDTPRRRNGPFPPADGGVTVLPQPSDRDAGVIGFTAHAVIFTDADPDWVDSQLPPGDLGAPLSPTFLQALSEATNRRPGSIDMLCVAESLPGPPPIDLAPEPDTDAFAGRQGAELPRRRAAWRSGRTASCCSAAASPAAGDGDRGR